MRDENQLVLQWGAVIVASAIAAIVDVRTRRIPNALTLPLFAAGVVFSIWYRGLAGLADSLAACAVLALPYILMFLFAGGGAGDAKLMGAIGAWLGLKYGIIVLICVVGAGVILALIKAAMRRRLKAVLTEMFITTYTFILFLLCQKKLLVTIRNRRDEANYQPGDLTVSYGLAILAGVCIGGGIILLW